MTLALFAHLLTQFDSEFAGRVQALIGKIYFTVSLIWLSAVEGTKPDTQDIASAAVVALEL